MATVVGSLVLFLLLNLALSGFILWLACRVLRRRRVVRAAGGPDQLVPVSYRRALGAAVVFWLLGSLGAAGTMWAVRTTVGDELAASLLALGATFLLASLVVR